MSSPLALFLSKFFEGSLQSCRDLPQDQSLVLRALGSLKNGNAESIVDPRLRGCIQIDCLKKYVELGASCFSEGHKRPTWK